MNGVLLRRDGLARVYDSNQLVVLVEMISTNNEIRDTCERTKENHAYYVNARSGRDHIPTPPFQEISSTLTLLGLVIKQNPH